MIPFEPISLPLSPIFLLPLSHNLSLSLSLRPLVSSRFLDASPQISRTQTRLFSFLPTPSPSSHLSVPLPPSSTIYISTIRERNRKEGRSFGLLPSLYLAPISSSLPLSRSPFYVNSRLIVPLFRLSFAGEARRLISSRRPRGERGRRELLRRD